MDLPTSTLTLLVLVSLALNLVLAIGLIAVYAQRGKAGAAGGDVELDEEVREVLERHGYTIKRLEGAIRKLAAQDRALADQLSMSVQRVGLVRYDAFAEMGGRLSFSCAFLDEHGDGVVVTSINGRQDTRVYAKPVHAGRSSHNLSVEEEQSIRQALEEEPQETKAVSGQ
jgi:uncharacterized membrane protein